MTQDSPPAPVRAPARKRRSRDQEPAFQDHQAEEALADRAPVRKRKPKAKAEAKAEAEAETEASSDSDSKPAKKKARAAKPKKEQRVDCTGKCVVRCTASLPDHYGGGADSIVVAQGVQVQGFMLPGCPRQDRPHAARYQALQLAGGHGTAPKH